MVSSVFFVRQPGSEKEFSEKERANTSAAGRRGFSPGMLALGFASAAATSGSPPNRRSGGPDLQKLSTARERLFEAELELQGALAREASRPGPRPVSKALDRLQSVLVAALASPDEDGLCRLHHAVLEQDEDRVKCLVGAGAQTEVAAGEAGVLPLHLAVLAGDGSPGCMRELLAGGAKVALTLTLA